MGVNCILFAVNLEWYDQQAPVDVVVRGPNVWPCDVTSKKYVDELQDH